MTEPRKLRVFLCHATQDKPVVRELHQRLKAEGWIDSWLDEEKLKLGQHWTTAIEEALDAADIVLIFLSRNSVSKEGFVQRELNYAWELSLEKPRDVIFLIPFRLDECIVPRYLASRQWGDYFGGEKEQAYQILLHSLKQRHEQKLRLEAEELLDKARFQEEAEKNQIRQETEALQVPMAAVPTPEHAEKKRLSNEIPKPAPVQPDTSVSNKLSLSNGIEFMRVPAGEFLMGSTKESRMAGNNEHPQHAVNIPYDYWMARFPVTNSLYRMFTKDRFLTFLTGGKRTENRPVTTVNLGDAYRYCQWLNDLFREELPSGLIIRLPTEAEWEKAARGVNGNEWPWGNEFEIKKCNTVSNHHFIPKTTNVGQYSPGGDSPFGCADMAGNVWEWTHSLVKRYPYNADDGREDGGIQGPRILRGGSFEFHEDFARCAYRMNSFAKDLSDVGFRLIIAPPRIF